jgi:hypothetical protein
MCHLIWKATNYKELHIFYLPQHQATLDYSDHYCKQYLAASETLAYHENFISLIILLSCRFYAYKETLLFQLAFIIHQCIQYSSCSLWFLEKKVSLESIEDQWNVLEMLNQKSFIVIPAFILVQMLLNKNCSLIKMLSSF